MAGATVDRVMNAADTIVALSSPPGRSRRGLTRVCGAGARGVAEGLIERGGALPPRRLTPTRLAHPDLPALAVSAGWFSAPASYCGDDTFELQLPGHPALLERVLRACITLGARLAEPGEFTFRAFAAGKLDLLEAEGVAATIAARSDRQLRAAESLKQGELGRFTSEAVDELATLLALVEAGIDFTDQEDVVPIPPEVLDRRIESLRDRVDGLLRRGRSWGAIEALPRVVLAGPPSAGKSTLFNALLGDRRAVIDPQPGTTRDVLEATLTLPSGDEVLLIDLAGLDDAAALLDHEAQRLAREAITRADVVLQLDDVPGVVSGDAVVLPVRSRCDLDPPAPPPATRGAHRVSGLTGAGVDALRHAIVEALGQRGDNGAGEALVLQPRHVSALRDAGEALGHAGAAVDPGAASLSQPELVALALRSALDALGGLGGRMTPDDVIGRIFATFCVGK